MTQNVISRAQAKALGLKRYFTGNLCKYGHIAERRVLDGSCLQCTRHKLKKWYDNNPERARELQRRWRAANLERSRGIRRESARRAYAANPDKINARNRKWVIANPQKRRAIGRRWEANHPEQKRASIAKWKAENPEKLREIKRRYMVKRRARKRGASGIFSQKDIARIRELQNNRCAEPTCRKLLEKYHIDHVVPLAKGGSNWPRNLQLLCPRCNQLKSAYDPIDYAKRKGRLV